MPLSQEQIEKRRDGLGASDMAAILNLDPFRTSYDVMCEKRGLLAPQNGARPWLEAGNLLEPAIINWARTVLGPIDTPSEAFRDPKGSCLLAHPDGVVVANGRPVEAKSHLQYTDEHWGDPETDDIPDRVIIQGTVQMICLPSRPDICHVIALLPRTLFVPYIVRLNTDLADMIRKAADDFQKLKDSGGWPDASPSPNIIKRIRREPKGVVAVSEAVFVRARDLRQARLNAEGAEVAAMNALYGEIGTAEAGMCSEGVFTFLEQRGSPRIDKERLEADHPGLLGKYLIETTHRVPRFKK